MKALLLALLFVSTSLARAEDISSCTLKKVPDEMNYCKASFAGSGTFCDQIKNGELKRNCVFMVIKIQRNHTYSLKKPEDKKTDELTKGAEHR